MTKLLRRTDSAHLRGTGHKHDASAFIGDWRSTDRTTASIPRVVLSEGSGSLTIRVWGTGLEVGDPPIDWGDQPASLFETAPDDPQSGGLLATYDHGYAQTTIAGNSKRGTLVLATYTRFKDNSSRRDYYRRAFFHLAEEREGKVSEESTPPSLFGHWRNTHSGTLGIRDASLQMIDGQARLSLTGARDGFLEAGAQNVPARICGPAFIADCTIGSWDLRLACNLNRGLLIIAAFARSSSGESRFLREFYYNR